MAWPAEPEPSCAYCPAPGARPGPPPIPASFERHSRLRASAICRRNSPKPRSWTRPRSSAPNHCLGRELRKEQKVTVRNVYGAISASVDKDRPIERNINRLPSARMCLISPARCGAPIKTHMFPQTVSLKCSATTGGLIVPSNDPSGSTWSQRVTVHYP